MPALPRIMDVERITLDVPFRPRCAVWNELLVKSWRIVEVIRITTDVPDVVGYGETLPFYTFMRVPDSAIERVKGKPAAECLGDDSLSPGLQMAIYDVVGKAMGVPIHKLLTAAQVREWCPIAWWNTKMSPEDLACEAQDAVSEGYTAHKFKARPWFDVFAQVEAIQAVTPARYKLDMDFNEMLLNVGNATPILRELDTFPQVALYESPIFHRDMAGYQELRSKIAKPLAVHFSGEPFTTRMRMDNCDGFVVGWEGIAATLRQGLLAGTFDKSIFLQMVGTGITTSLMTHLGAVLPAAQWPAVTCMNIWADDLVTAPLTIRGGLIKTPDAPGLGVTVDETALSRYAMQPPFEVEPPRHILSVKWEGGRVLHGKSLPQLWDSFWKGNFPNFERGVRLHVLNDDGSKDWADLYARVQTNPVWDVT